MHPAVSFPSLFGLSPMVPLPPSSPPPLRSSALSFSNRPPCPLHRLCPSLPSPSPQLGSVVLKSAALTSSPTVPLPPLPLSAARLRRSQIGHPILHTSLPPARTDDLPISTHCQGEGTGSSEGGQEGNRDRRTGEQVIRMGAHSWPIRKDVQSAAAGSLLLLPSCSPLHSPPHHFHRHQLCRA